MLKDEAKAMEWYLQAAENGNSDAMYNIGVMYENGMGVASDSQKAEEWYQKAREAESVENSAPEE